MRVIRYPDGTEVLVDEPAEPPAHTRRGRFERRKQGGESERQRIERGLGSMFRAAKSFLLDEDEDDIAVAAKMLAKATKDE